MVNQYHRSRTSQFGLQGKWAVSLPYNTLRMKTATSQASSFNSREWGNNNAFHLLASCPSLDAGELSRFPFANPTDDALRLVESRRAWNIAESLALRSGSRVELGKFGRPRARVLSCSDIWSELFSRINLSTRDRWREVVACFTLAYNSLYIVRSEHALKGQRIGPSSASSAARPVLSGPERS